MTTYEMCKILIERKRFVKNDMIRKLDVFLLGNRITEEQYSELVTKMNNVQ